ncbi:MAG: site-specific integrase [Methylococcales bacterium]
MSREGKAKVLTDAELLRVVKLQKLSKHAKRNIALIYCSFALGLRAKELAALKVRDLFNIDTDTLLTVIQLKSAYTKGEKQRDVYLSNAKLQIVLIEYLSERYSLIGSEPLFLSQKRCSFSANTIQMLFSKMYKEAGIIGASSHSGRRTFATRLIEQGADIKAVSTLMGHASIAMTAEYVENNPDRLAKLVLLAI